MVSLFMIRLMVMLEMMLWFLMVCSGGLLCVLVCFFLHLMMLAALYWGAEQLLDAEWLFDFKSVGAICSCISCIRLFCVL